MVRSTMRLQRAVQRVVKASGLPPLVWAETRAAIPKSTFRGLMRDGTCTGRTLAKLLAAGVEVADEKLIASLDPKKKAA